jgi:hypothetical protein
LSDHIDPYEDHGTDEAMMSFLRQPLSMPKPIHATVLRLRTHHTIDVTVGINKALKMS